MDKNFSCYTRVDAPLEDAYKAVSRVSEWWTECFSGLSTRKDDIFTVTFGQSFLTMQVTAALPFNLIRWTVADSYLHWLDFKYEWQNSELIWEFGNDQGQTKITLTHAGFSRDVERFKASAANGWTFYVTESIPMLLRTGQGLPRKKYRG